MASFKHLIKILYVSDDQDDVFLLRIAAEEAGFHNLTSFSPNGESRAVLDYLQKENQSQVPDLILVDARIPPADGFQIVQLIREHPRFNPIHIALVSGSEDYLKTLEKHYLGVNPDKFLKKPFNIEDLEGLYMNVLPHSSENRN